MEHRWYKYVIVFVTLLVINNQVIGQTDSSGTHWTTYDQNSSRKKTANSSTTSSSHANAIKAGIFCVLMGKYGLAYERELNSTYSIEAGLGLTGRNITGNEVAQEYEWIDYNEGGSPNFSEQDDVSDDDYSFDSREAELGWF